MIAGLPIKSGALLIIAGCQHARNLDLGSTERIKEMYPTRHNRTEWPETMGEVDRWLSNAGRHLANLGPNIEARNIILDARDDLGISSTNINKDFVDVLIEREGFMCDECCSPSKGEMHEVVRHKGSFVTRIPFTSGTPAVYTEDTPERLCQNCFDWIR